MFNASTKNLTLRDVMTYQDHEAASRLLTILSALEADLSDEETLHLISQISEAAIFVPRSLHQANTLPK